MVGAPPTESLCESAMDLQALLDEVLPGRPQSAGVPPGGALTDPVSSAPYTTASRAQGVPRPVCETWPSGARRGIVEVKYTHDAMVDLILGNPSISQNELALHFKYTASWISQIISSDAFQARLAERTKEMVDPILLQSVEQRFKALVLRSQEILMEKLNKATEEIPDQLALRALELSSRAAGYGARQEPPPGPALNISVHLESMGDNLTKLLRKKRSEALDMEPVDD